MKKCIKCGSHAFNLYADGIDQGGFCDVHYWQGRAHRAEAQPEQEPVFLIYDDAGGWIESNESEYSKTEEANRWLLYTTPPPPQRTWERPWAGLTDEEIREINAQVSQIPPINYTTTTYARALEAKLKEKNT